VRERVEIFTGFNLKYWEKLGFRFTKTNPYEGRTVIRARKQFGNFEFLLIISNHNAIGSVENLSSKDEEHHVVSENEAVEWFSSKSVEFEQLAKAVR
jgi:hypothetical protein